MPRVFASRPQLIAYREKVLDPTKPQVTLAFMFSKPREGIPFQVGDFLTLPEALSGVDHGFMPLELMLQNQIEAYMSTESLKILVSTVEFNTPLPSLFRLSMYVLLSSCRCNGFT